MEAIPFFLAVRNIDFSLGTDTSPEQEVQAGSRHAVNVIISVQTDPFPLPDSQMQTINGPFHIRQCKRIMGCARGGREPVPGLTGLDKASSAQHRSRNR